MKKHKNRVGVYGVRIYIVLHVYTKLLSRGTIYILYIYVYTFSPITNKVLKRFRRKCP